MADYLTILPEICLVVLAALILLVDMRLSEQRKGALSWITLTGLIVTFALTLVYNRPDSAELIWSGMLRHDLVAFTFRLVFLAGAAITVMFAMNWEVIGKRGEFYFLLIISTLGMTLMGAAADLILLFLAIETASIPLYVMAGFMKEDDTSVEAGFKYLLFGAMTSAVMLYGFSLLYGFTGVTNLEEIAGILIGGGFPGASLMGAVILIMVGLGFKVSLVPFHFWAPDVYQGAATPVTGFLSTASKAAGFAVIIRVFMLGLPVASVNWVPMAAVLSAVTMTVGNLIALRQTNIKRMLAYSSIAHAGYIMMGVAANSEFGLSSVLYYIIVYLLSNLAAFGFVALYSRVIKSDEIADYAGLSRRNSGLAFALTFIFLSLGGIPPLGGFFAKILVFAAAVEVGMVWLAIIGVLNAVIALYYYLNLLKYVWLYRQEGDEEPLPIMRTQTITLMVLVLGVTALGVMMAPWYAWTTGAAGNFF